MEEARSKLFPGLCAYKVAFVSLQAPGGCGGNLVGGHGPEPLDWGWTRCPERDLGPTTSGHDRGGGEGHLLVPTACTPQQYHSKRERETSVNQPGHFFFAIASQIHAIKFSILQI